MNWGKLAHIPRTRLRTPTSGLFQAEETKVPLTLGTGHVLASLGMGDEKVARRARSQRKHLDQGRFLVAGKEVLEERK